MPRQTSLLAACERSLRRDWYWAVNGLTGKTRKYEPEFHIGNQDRLLGSSVRIRSSKPQEALTVAQ